MADGRKIPYLIELVADDKKIRQQMAKINWEELLGSKGKGFGDVLVSDAKEAKDQIKRTLGGLDIDWSKILGAKEIGQLEQAVTKALSKSRKEIELFAASGDTTGLEKTIKYVSALGEELKGLGSSFDAASLARGMSAFMKVLTPLTAKFEALADEPKKVEAAFDKLFSGKIVSGATQVNNAVENIAKTTEKTINVFARMDGVLKSQGGLEKTRANLEALYDLLASDAQLPDFSGMSIDQLLKQVQQLDEQWDEIDKKANFGAYTKEQDAQVAHIMAQLVQIDKLLPNGKKILVPIELDGQKFGASAEDYEKDVKETVANIKKELDEVEEKIKKSLGDSFAEVISKQVSDIKLNLSIDNKNKEQLITSINEYVAELNKSPIDKIKLQPDITDVANIIENQSKRAYGDNAADDDVNTTKIVEQTEKRLDRIASAIKGKQDKIVEQTQNWRQQMKDAMDIEFKWASDGSATLFNAIQDYFDENQIEVTLNKQALSEQFKAAFQDAGINMSGKVGVDAKSLQSIVSSILYGTKGGQSINDVDNDIPSDVESSTSEIEKSVEDVVDANRKYVSSLDDAPDQVREVIENLKGLIKYAIDGDSKNAIKTRERLYAELFPDHKKAKDQSAESFGLDIVNRLSGLLASSDDDIKKVINDAILRFNPTYGFEGAKVRDDLTELKSVDKISTKKLSNFLSSLNNLFTALGLQTDDVIEIERRIAGKGIFEETLKKAKVGKSIAGLRSIAGNEDLTKVPTMDEIKMLISNMEDEGLDTTSANELLGWKDALGDATDEGSLATFREQLKNFVTGVDGIYQGIKRIIKEYEATVTVVDQVSGAVHDIAVKGSGVRGGVKFDNIINASKNIERAMDDGKKVGYTTHKAYGSWRILGGSKETRSSEAKALRGTKNTYTTPKSQEDPRGYDTTYNGIPDPSIDIIASIERTIELNESKISELNSKLARQRKELKKLIEENAEQSILDAKQAEIDADTKTRDEIKALNKKDKIQLDSLKLQKEERDIKTRDDYTRESIQVIDNQITETQAKINELQVELASVDERLASVAPTKSIDFVKDEFVSRAKDLNKQAAYVDIITANNADWIKDYAQKFGTEEEKNKTKEIAEKYNEEKNAYNQILSGLNSRIALVNEVFKHIKEGQDLNTKLSVLENDLNQMQPEYDKFSEEVKTIRESYNQRIDKLTKEMNRAKKDSTKESKRQQIHALEDERKSAIVGVENRYMDVLTRRENLVNQVAATKTQIADNQSVISSSKQWIEYKKREIAVIDEQIAKLKELKAETTSDDKKKDLDAQILRLQGKKSSINTQIKDSQLSKIIEDPSAIETETKKEIANLGQFVSSVDKDISEMYDRWHKGAVGAQKDLVAMREPIAKQFRAEYKTTVDQIFDLGKQLEKNPADETLKVQFQNAVEYLRILESEYAKFIRITNNDGVKHKPLISKDKEEQLSGLINTYGDNNIGNAAVFGRKSQIEADLKDSNRDLERLNEQRAQQQSTLLTEIDAEEQERLEKLKSIQEKRAKVDEQIAKLGYNQVRLPDDVDEKEKERIALNETKIIQALMSKAYDKRNAYRSDVTKYSREVEDLDKWRGISGPGRKIAREFPDQLVGEYKTSNHYKNITLSAKEEVGGDELAKAIQENIERRERWAIESYINDLGAKSNQNIEVEVDKYRRTDEYKSLDAQAQKEAAQRYKAKLQVEADRTNKELLAQYQSSDRFKQIAIDAKSEVMKTGSEFSFQFTPEQWKVIEEKQKAAIKEYTDSIIYDDDTKKHTYTKYVKNEDGVEEAVRVTVDIFDDLLKTLRSKLEYAQGKFEQAQTEVESLQNAQKEVREYGHLDSDTVYNQQEVGRLRSVQTLKEEATNKRNGVLRQLALLEEQKTLLGEIENLKSKGEGDKTLEPYQDKLKEINEELSKLYERYKVDVSEEEKDSKLEAKIKTAEKKLSEEIASYEATEKAIQQRIFNKNEQRVQSKDPKESEQRILASIEGYNKNIEKSQERQRQLKEKIAEVTGVEKEQLQRQLESAEKNERNLEARRNNQNKNLDRLRKKQTKAISEATESGTSTSGGLLGIIKEVVGEVGGVDLTKVEEILGKILDIISGNGVVGSTRNSDMDAKLARIKELEAKQQLANEQKKTAETVKQVENAKKETAESTNVADTKAHKNVSKTQVYKDVQKSVDAFRTSELTADKEPLNAIKLALDELSKINDQNSQEYVEWQRKLGSALAAYGKKNGVEDGKGYYDRVYAELAKNGVNIDPKLAITNANGISNALVEKRLVAIKEKEAQAKQSEAKAEKEITEEKKKQEQIRFTRKEKRELNRLKNETKDYNPDAVRSNETTSGGLGSLAREDTLSKILEVLNAFKSEGVKTTGKAKSDAEEKTPKKTEAELIKERALKDKDAVLGIASNSKVKKKYEQLVKQLESETDLAKIKTLAQKTTALGFNIKKESAEWDYKTADANRVYNIPNANAFGKRPETVRRSMEKLAQTKFNPDGKQYEFLNFDGKNLSYQLTDIHGNVEKVTMSWSELNNQVAITSDKSVAKLETLANKVQTFKDKFENTTQMGYLAEDDETYKKFLDKVADIDTQSTFEDVERVRNEALQLADEVTKKVNANKKLYTGTSEMNAATKQYEHLASGDILDHEKLDMVKEYKNQYAKLLKLHNDLKSGADKRGLLDETAQKDLLKASLETKRLGKELEKATSNSQRLRQAIDSSGVYNGQDLGGEFKVEDPTKMYDQMIARLKELGAEHIKVDRVRQIATGTIRHNNRTVSDLTVEYDKLRGSLARYQKQERESLTGLPAFLNGFQKKFNSIMQYLTMTMSIHQVLSQLRKGVQYVKEIDLALTELRKVTNETEATYDKFLQTAASTGARLGATISAVTEATATFSKLGYSMSQASEMAEAAIVYKNVGDNIASTEDAADSIISTLKGFGLESSQTMAIVDKFNEVGE